MAKINTNFNFDTAIPSSGTGQNHSAKRIIRNNLAAAKFNEYERAMVAIVNAIGDTDLITEIPGTPQTICDAIKAIYDTLMQEIEDLTLSKMDTIGNVRIYGSLTLDGTDYTTKTRDISTPGRVNARAFNTEWRSDGLYDVGDIVIHDDGIYECITTDEMEYVGISGDIPFEMRYAQYKNLGNGPIIEVIINTYPTMHGFVPGNVVRYDNGWSLAIADSYSNVGVGYVNRCQDNYTFTLAFGGFTDNLQGVTDEDGNSLVLNVDYFLSDTTAGKLTRRQPVISQFVLRVVAQTSTTLGGILGFGSRPFNGTSQSVPTFTAPGTPVYGGQSYDLGIYPVSKDYLIVSSNNTILNPLYYDVDGSSIIIASGVISNGTNFNVRCMTGMHVEPSSCIVTRNYTATENQTIFDLDLPTGLLEGVPEPAYLMLVVQNGAVLFPTVDYSYSSGTMVLAAPATLSDKIMVQVITHLNIVYPGVGSVRSEHLASNLTFSNNVSISGTLTVSGTLNTSSISSGGNVDIEGCTFASNSFEGTKFVDVLTTGSSGVTVNNVVEYTSTGLRTYGYGPGSAYGNTITKRYEVLFNTSMDFSCFAITSLTENKFVAAYRNPSNSTSYLRVIQADDSYQSIATGTVVTLGTFTLLEIKSITKTKFILTYSDGTSFWARIGIVSGTTITLGTAFAFSAAAGNTVIPVVLSETKVLVAYKKSNGTGAVIVLTISGTTITAPVTETVFSSSSTSLYDAAVYLSDTSTYWDCVIAYRNSGDTTNTVLRVVRVSSTNTITVRANKSTVVSGAASLCKVSALNASTLFVVYSTTAPATYSKRFLKSGVVGSESFAEISGTTTTINNTNTVYHVDILPVSEYLINVAYVYGITNQSVTTYYVKLCNVTKSTCTIYGSTIADANSSLSYSKLFSVSESRIGLLFPRLYSNSNNLYFSFFDIPYNEPFNIVGVAGETVGASTSCEVITGGKVTNTTAPISIGINNQYCPSVCANAIGTVSHMMFRDRLVNPIVRSNPLTKIGTLISTNLYLRS